MADTIPCRKAFTSTLLEQAKQNKNIVVLTSDARGSVTLDEFAKTLPEQFVEIGIAEQDSVGISAGIASCGKNVFVCGPACFLSARSFEQVKVDVAYSHTNVKVIGVSGGVSYGALGMTHYSLHDIAAMRAAHGITVILPADANQAAAMTKALCDYEGPVYVRMGRNAVGDVYEKGNVPFVIGKANLLKDGNDITLIGTGETVLHALNAGKKLEEAGIHARVIDMHTISPLDTEILLRAAKETKAVITVEEHSIYGGLGAAVSEFLIQNHPIKMKILGIPEGDIAAGNSLEIFKHYGLDEEGIVRAAKELLD